MNIENISKRLIVLTVAQGKTWEAIHVPSGATKNDDRITTKTIKRYVDEGSIKEVKSETKNKTKTDPDPIVLIEPVTKESLKALNVTELKQYCKEHKLTPYAKLKEDELITKILESLTPAE